MLKKKFVAVIIFSLLLTVSLSSYATANFKQDVDGENISTLDDIVDAPTWDLGNNWTYKGYYRQMFGMFFNWKLIVQDLEFTVADIDSNSYYLVFDGSIEWGIGIGDFFYPLVNGTLEGYTIVNKSDLGVFEVSAHANCYGKIVLIRLPFDVYANSTSDPALSCFKFPFSIGDSWTSTLSEISFEIKLAMFGSSESFQRSGTIPNMPVTCIKKETITVEAGTYETYNITMGGIFDMFYSPMVGNVVKISRDDPPGVRTLNIELKSTNTI